MGLGTSQEALEMTKASSPTKGRPKKIANSAATPRVPEGTESKEGAEPKEDLVVFAFRLTAAERELLHEAAGPAKASRFVRTLAVAVARGDRARLDQILGAIDTVN